MAVTLRTALHYHQELLGANFENLGRQDCCSKIYLTYDETYGWNVQTYHLFWRIIRYLLGCFADSHLKNVVQALSTESSIPEELKERMRHLWEQSYPTDACPLQAHRNSHVTELPDQNNFDEVQDSDTDEENDTNQHPQLSTPPNQPQNGATAYSPGEGSPDRGDAPQGSPDRGDVPLDTDRADAPLDSSDKGDAPQDIGKDNTPPSHEKIIDEAPKPIIEQTLEQPHPLPPAAKPESPHQNLLMHEVTFADAAIGSLEPELLTDDDRDEFFDHLTDETGTLIQLSDNDFTIPISIFNASNPAMHQTFALPSAMFEGKKEGDTVSFKWDNQLITLKLRQLLAANETPETFEEVFDQIKYLAALKNFFKPLESPVSKAVSLNNEALSHSACVLTISSNGRVEKGALDELWNQGEEVHFSQFLNIVPKLKVHKDNVRHVLVFDLPVKLTDIQLLWDNDVLVVQAKKFQNANSLTLSGLNRNFEAIISGGIIPAETAQEIVYYYGIFTHRIIKHADLTNATVQTKENEVRIYFTINNKG